LQKGATESSLITKAGEYLGTRYYETLEEAEYAAAEFIKFCRGRAWVFTDTGTTNTGERLYQFTHRTFLEYFTAEYLVRNKDLESLFNELNPRIRDAEWDVVVQLIVQLIEQKSEGAGDQLLSMLVDWAESQDLANSWGAISFSVRCLNFIVPAPSLRRKIVRAAIHKAIDLGSEIEARNIKRKHFIQRKSEPETMLFNLLNCAEENCAIVYEVIEQVLISEVSNHDMRRSQIASQITLRLRSIRLSNRFFQLASVNDVNLVSLLKDKIISQCKDYIKEACKLNSSLSIEAYLANIITLEELLSVHGPECLFRHRELIISSGFYHSPVSQTIVDQILQYIMNDRRPSSRWETLGNLLATYPTPWVKNVSTDGPEREGRAAGHFDADPIDQEGIEKFGMLSPDYQFTLFVVVAEWVEELPEAAVRHIIKRDRNTIWSLFKDIILARLDRQKLDVSITQFSDGQQQFIRNWACSCINLVERSEV